MKEKVDLPSTILSLTSRCECKENALEHFDKPVMTFKETGSYLHSYQQNCDATGKWVLLAQLTRTLVSLDGRKDVSGLETMLLLHALLEVPDGKRAALVNLAKPFITMLRRAYVFRSFFWCAHIPAEKREDVIKEVSAFDFAPRLAGRH